MAEPRRRKQHSLWAWFWFLLFVAGVCACISPPQSEAYATLPDGSKVDTGHKMDACPLWQIIAATVVLGIIWLMALSIAQIRAIERGDIPMPRPRT